jgi:protein-tyrosine-phosphatase
VRVARDWNLDLREHRTHRLADADLGWADLVLAMTGSQHVQLTQRWRQFAGNVRLLGDYLSEPPHVIADPYGESDEIFRHAFGQIDRAVQRLLKLMPSA